jgi:tetratricopeptide (TPR) repeat protein
MEFMRFTAPDADALAKGIQEARSKLAEAQRVGDTLASVEHAGDLGSMLTTARLEAEALTVMQDFLFLADSMPNKESTGWFWNAYATALQYNGRRSDADSIFTKALTLSRDSRWSRLQSFILQHWGRSLVEQDRLDEAEACFSEALDIRVELNDPRQESTRRALAALAQIRMPTKPEPPSA